MGLAHYVILCPDCAKKELDGKPLSHDALDYDEYYCSGGLEFLGCPHLTVVEKETKIGF